MALGRASGRSGGVGLAPGAMAKVDNQLRKIPKPADPGPQPRPVLESMWARVTGLSSGVYQWIRQYWDAGTGAWTDQPGAVAGTGLLEARGQGFAVGSTVRIKPVSGAAGAMGMMGVAIGTPLYLVALTTDGGATGTQTTSPTYTYSNPTDVVSGVEITRADGSSATALTPAWGRPWGDFAAATMGIVYIGADANPVLLICNEIERDC